MSEDEDREALARARAAAPDDAGLALRHARALARAGRASEAEAVLVAILDHDPGHEELTAELDAIGRGRRLGAPWPSGRGDPSRTARSSAVGPSRGVVVERIAQALPDHARTLVVESPGRALATTREALCSLDGRGEVGLVAALPRDLDVAGLVLLPRGRTLVLSGSQALALVPEEGRLARVHRRYAHATAFAAGASGLLHAASKAGRVVALGLAAPSEARTVLRTEPDAGVGLALAPGGDLVVAVEGEARSSRPAVLARLSSRGQLRWRRELAARSLGQITTQPVVGLDGTAWLAFPGDRLLGIDAAGATVVDVPEQGEPSALAGADADVLVLRSERSLVLLETRTGRVRGRLDGAFFSPPKVDSRGWVFVRRGDDLLAWDPASPAGWALEVAAVGSRWWDFAFAGEGRIFALPRTGEGSELVVIE